MINSNKEITLDGKKVNLKLLIFKDSDRAKIKSLFVQWKKLNVGLKKISTRGINLPESISESAFCLFFKDHARVIGALGGASSFDVINLRTLKRIELKATSIGEDLTSFSPNSSWDNLYLLDFSRMDGSFDVYEIPNYFLSEKYMNKTETFKQQQEQGRRPRFSIMKDIIRPNNLKPIRTCKL